MTDENTVLDDTDKSPKTKRVAELSSDNLLIGSREVPATDDGIDFGDLPTNGTYQWNGKSFVAAAPIVDDSGNGFVSALEQTVVAAEAEPVDGAPAPTKTKQIAVLSNEGRLIGAQTVPVDADGLDFGDLPLDGTYKYVDAKKTFMPVGTGFGKVLSPMPPYSLEFVVSLMIDKMNPDDVPGPVGEWQDWFKADLRRREEERASGRTRL